jgi:hypothetical protein
LAQHGVHESGLAVVNMGNDGDITYRLGHREFFLLLAWPMGYGLGDNTVISGQGSESPFGALSTATIAAQCGNFYCISSVEKRGFGGRRRVEPSEPGAGCPRYTGLAC